MISSAVRLQPFSKGFFIKTQYFGVALVHCRKRTNWKMLSCESISFGIQFNLAASVACFTLRYPSFVAFSFRLRLVTSSWWDRPVVVCTRWLTVKQSHNRPASDKRIICRAVSIAAPEGAAVITTELPVDEILDVARKTNSYLLVLLPSIWTWNLSILTEQNNHLEQFYVAGLWNNWCN